MVFKVKLSFDYFIICFYEKCIWYKVYKIKVFIFVDIVCFVKRLSDGLMDYMFIFLL